MSINPENPAVTGERQKGHRTEAARGRSLPQEEQTRRNARRNILFTEKLERREGFGYVMRGTHG